MFSEIIKSDYAAKPTIMFTRTRHMSTILAGKTHVCKLTCCDATVDYMKEQKLSDYSLYMIELIYLFLCDNIYIFIMYLFVYKR